MSKKRILILYFLVGCFGLFKITLASETECNWDKQKCFENDIFVHSLNKDVTLTNVYICKGPSSKRYHYKKNCRGLKPCSTKVYEVSMSEAKELKRTLCGWED